MNDNSLKKPKKYRECRKITFSEKELEMCTILENGKFDWFKKRGSKIKFGCGKKIYTDLMLPKVT